jgi:sulfhydrogenase subunit beta (sulfur reductase)
MGYFIKKRDIPRFLDTLMSKHKVIAPVKKDIVRYCQINSPKEVTFDFVNSIYPLKEYFLPIKETLFKFHDGKISMPQQEKGVVLFGIRPCDINAILRMDKLFLDECPDPYYALRREHNIIIGLSCTISGENCMCESFGTDKIDEGYDLLFTPTGDGYYVDVGSERGGKLIDKKLFKESKDVPIISVHNEKKIPEEQIAKLKTSFKSSIWNEEAEKCLSCSACTMTCPTCGCFRVFDTPDLKGGCREREWTSCQLRNFTSVAGGYSFREDRAMRLKNRIYHQLVYFKDRFGVHMCVGCGRCITNCPPKIDMQKTIEKL